MSSTMINPELENGAVQNGGTMINTESVADIPNQGTGTLINEAEPVITQPLTNQEAETVAEEDGTPTPIRSNTELNLDGVEVVVASSSQGTGTLINTASMMKTELLPGQHFQGESGKTYVIIEKINKSSGEATLFKAKGLTGDTEYVIKVYDKIVNRVDAIKEEIVEKLKAIDCPYLPKLFETGRLNGYPYEIMEFYSGGSLTHARMTLEELKESFIPAMNDALRVLDENGILHKDIKPDNIMRRGNSYVLMDFGISSVRNDSNSVVFTHTGWSPEYAPPEASQGNASIKWDYYSLGVTIFELYFGHRPYGDKTPEERAILTLQAEDEEDAFAPILKDADCPDELKALIRGLTRKRRKTRWSYEQVSNWLEGKTVVEPSGKTEFSRTIDFPFDNETYTDLDKLVQALGEKWNKGKGQLFRGYLGDHLTSEHMYDLASICADFAEMDGDQDMLFANWLYTISKNLDRLYWKGSNWSPLELGQEILAKLWECMDVYNKENAKKLQNYLDFLESDALILFYREQEEVSAEHVALSRRVSDLVERIRKASVGGTVFYRCMYELAYALTRTPVLSIAGKQFPGYTAFMEYMTSLFSSMEKEEEMKNFLNKLGMKKGAQWDSNSLELQFGCWLDAVKEYSR